MSHTHVRAPDDSPVQAVINAVAASAERSPLELPPLGQVITPDALDALLSKADHQVEVSFDYLDYEVVGTSDEVRVVPLGDE